jgi:hypothetical protein
MVCRARDSSDSFLEWGPALWCVDGRRFVLWVSQKIEE